MPIPQSEIDRFKAKYERYPGLRGGVGARKAVPDISFPCVGF